MKLWEKNNTAIDKVVERFTVGDDYIVDMALINYDIIASIAHAKTLFKAGILNEKELKQLVAELQKLSVLADKKEFFIKQEDEDMHTAIENYLVSKLGETGKKIHTARSRNDQVLAALRLYYKEQLIILEQEIVQLIATLIETAKKNEFAPVAGYTHMQKAMPSSFGIFFGAYAESFIDSIKVIETAFQLCDQCPLGSGAGYGVSIDIDREYTAALLGFSKVQNNVMYVQNSRGKIELTLLHAMHLIMNDLARLSNDLIIFSIDEFKFISLPNEFCTGSSIMPQKNNPDVLELIRAKASVVSSHYFLVNSAVSKLFSGYNRDLQLTKKPVIESFNICIDSLRIMDSLLKKIIVNEEKCIDSFSAKIFAADNAYELVKKGMPFREAYKVIGNELSSAKDFTKEKKENIIDNILKKKNKGHSGNLRLDDLNKEVLQKEENVKKEKEKSENKMNKLLFE